MHQQVDGFKGDKQVDVHYALKYDRCFSDDQNAIHPDISKGEQVVHFICDHSKNNQITFRKV